jgi:hypothetical protein
MRGVSRQVKGQVRVSRQVKGQVRVGEPVKELVKHGWQMMLKQQRSDTGFMLDRLKYLLHFSHIMYAFSAFPLGCGDANSSSSLVSSLLSSRF